MIKSIDIVNFGSFKNFVWRSSLRDKGNNVAEFKRLNICYGRNYSGKTTLSRIFRSFQEHKFPANYETPSFTINTDSKTLDQTQITSHTLDIRVYNKDFVTENLSIFNNTENGEIKTFAIVGGENNELERQITRKETELGSAEVEGSLKSKYAIKTFEFKTKQDGDTNAKNALEEKLRRFANDNIKHNRDYGSAGYDLRAIKKDIDIIQADLVQILDIDKIKDRTDLLKEEVLPDIGVRISFTPHAKFLCEEANTLLVKEIAPTKPIQELLNDAVLQSWVKSGMSHHRDKRETCGFCRQPLPDNLWRELDAHFSKESVELEESLVKQIETAEAEIVSLKTILTIERESFYLSKRSSFDEAKNTLNKEVKAYEKELESIIKALRARQSDIFTPMKGISIRDNTNAIATHVEEINKLISGNNLKTKSLAKDKNTAREELRIHAVANFIQAIDLDTREKECQKLTKAAADLKIEKDLLEDQVNTLSKEIEALKIRLKDEKKGAEKINEYLNHFLGNEGLKLEAVEDVDAAKFKFQIMRGTDPAYNLSEGECSLVSFCYFMAKLEDADTKGKDIIIYIDDPISSLDSNHIFFVYSLIESIITKPRKMADGSNECRYKQLFISTHNLDFFKYLKRLTGPGDKKGGTEYFIVEQSANGSCLSLMPSYLRDYVTEFNYLFHQIYKCRNVENAKESYESFYGFGNNLRKFLEAYLFYKYPYHDNKGDKLERLTKFFGDDTTSIALTNRLNNELSHLEEIFDRSMRPIEIPEIPKLANFVLDKIFEKDRDQYNSLLKSIGESPR